ncbi:MAG: tetratricopeptide repeat protein [Desulfobacterales bacterium]|nr:tetratricopeptide repeat protein [Desulfobacterales bacterium]
MHQSKTRHTAFAWPPWVDYPHKPGTMILIGLVCLWAVAFGCGGSEIERAKRYIGEGKFSQAIALLGERVAEKPEDADAHFLLGVAYLHSGHLREAEGQFKRALSLNSDAGLQIGREYKKAGNTAFREGKPETGVRFFKTAVRYHPDLKKAVARSAYEQGKGLWQAGNDALAIDLHRYAMTNDPMLGKELGTWYATKAINASSAPEKAALRQLAVQFDTAYREEMARIQRTADKAEAEKGVLSVRARMKRVIEQRLDERAWERLAEKGIKTLGAEETVRWTVKYYQKAGYEVKRLALSDKGWLKIGSFANRSHMFFLSADDFWYIKSSWIEPQRLPAAIGKARGIQFRGDAYMDIAVKSDTPPSEIFYWVSQPQ